MRVPPVSMIRYVYVQVRIQMSLFSPPRMTSQQTPMDGMSTISTESYVYERRANVVDIGHKSAGQFQKNADITRRMVLGMSTKLQFLH